MFISYWDYNLFAPQLMQNMLQLCETIFFNDSKHSTNQSVHYTPNFQYMMHIHWFDLLTPIAELNKYTQLINEECCSFQWELINLICIGSIPSATRFTCWKNITYRPFTTIQTTKGKFFLLFF